MTLCAPGLRLPSQRNHRVDVEEAVGPIGLVPFGIGRGEHEWRVDLGMPDVDIGEAREAVIADQALECRPELVE
jgi:hypothetical protein